MCLCISWTTRRASTHGLSDHRRHDLDIHNFPKNCNGNELKQHFLAQDTSSSNNYWNLCSNRCSCLRSAHARWAVKGVWDRSIRPHFDLGGHFLLRYLFFWAPFFTQKLRFQAKLVSEVEPKGGIIGTVFRKNQKIGKCVSTAQARTDCM